MNKDQNSLVEELRYTPLTNEDVEILEKNHSDEMRRPYYWGYVTSAEASVPEDPQLFAAGTSDPYAPFAFNQGIQWESFYYDDGSIYEGTMTENFPHGKGVLSIGFMGQCGLITNSVSKETQFGDMYEGEFNLGFVHGMGKYIDRSGYVYQGEFMAGTKHGCGEIKDFRSYLTRVQSGFDPLKAWKISASDIDTKKIQGTWLNDYFSEGPDRENSGSACSPTEIAGVVEESDAIANRSRMFRYKPDGAAQIFYQDSGGIPAKTLQDPLHYPYGTMFTAPGPASQIFPLPDDDSVKDEMIRVANLWRSIFNDYNFDPQPEADDTFSYALQMWAEADFHEQRYGADLFERRIRSNRRR